VVASGESIVWMRGFAVPAQFQPREGSAEAVVIEEVPLRAQRRERNPARKA